MKSKTWNDLTPEEAKNEEIKKILLACIHSIFNNPENPYTKKTNKKEKSSEH